MSLIHLSEKSRDAFFGQLVKQTVLERVRGGNGLCYEPPIQIEADRWRNKNLGSNTPYYRRGVITSLLGTTKSLIPPHHTYRSEAFAEDLVDELNQQGRK